MLPDHLEGLRPRMGFLALRPARWLRCAAIVARLAAHLTGLVARWACPHRSVGVVQSGVRAKHALGHRAECADSRRQCRQGKSIGTLIGGSGIFQAAQILRGRHIDARPKLCLGIVGVACGGGDGRFERAHTAVRGDRCFVFMPRGRFLGDSNAQLLLPAEILQTSITLPQSGHAGLVVGFGLLASQSGVFAICARAWCVCIHHTFRGVLQLGQVLCSGLRRPSL
mmetsp:Transcript_9532/g.24896  ORF Transcript_9532/g.24896 Transcript_9532/m.24896 type:complete len:225 (-) Transcript_9532:1002-1676(-)